MKSLPPLFLDRLKMILPPDIFNGAVNAFHVERPVSLRRNTNVYSAPQIRERLLADHIVLNPVEWNPEAFILQSGDIRALQANELFLNGHVYIQNLSSMLPVLCLGTKPGETVLDMCAAPGSKATQLALALEGEGKLYLNEKIRERFFRLKKNIDLQGYQNTELSLKPGAWFGHGMPDFFDKILLDAPCSSEGRFHLSRPKSFQFWKPMKIRECQKKQKRLLRSAMHALKPGGVMIYATCTFAPEENEAVIDWALRTMGDELELQPLDLPVSNVMEGLRSWKDKTFNENVRLCRRVLPNAQMDGFFMAKLGKK